MQQQINFYRADFQGEQRVFGANTLIISCSAILLGLLVAYVFASQKVNDLQNELNIISRQEVVAMQRLEQIQPVINAVNNQQSWSQRLEVATRALQEKQLMLSLLQGSTLGDTRGFARHLRSLAREDTDVLWLTRISLSALGDQNQLQGKALRADYVASYLQGLAQQPPFAKQRFNQFEITGLDDGSGMVAFSMNSDAGLLTNVVEAR